MTDCDNRLSRCQTRILSRDSSIAPVTFDQNTTAITANTDSEGDYETSSEGPHSPCTETQAEVQDTGNRIQGVDHDHRRQNDKNASYTVIGQN